MKLLEPQAYVSLREGASVLEADSSGEKVLRLADGSIFKLFRRKRLISSAAWYPYAQRFADNAASLERLGVPVPKVIGIYRIPHLARDAVHYAPLAGATLREMARSGMAAALEARLKEQFTRFVISLHDRGIYFRSLHLGNVVCTPEGQLGLIDFSDLHVHRRPLGRHLRERNLLRLQGLADEAGWLDVGAIVAAAPPRSRIRVGADFGPRATFALAIARALLCGRLRYPAGHRPPSGHPVPADFAGVGVAASADPAVDAFILARLDELGIRHVRLDFTDGDGAGPTARLLDALLERGLRVVLHLVQAPGMARRMPDEEACRAWRTFVSQTLDRYGGQVEAVEIGTTVNRQRWCGHSLAGFLAMWAIGWQEARARGLLLAGPNVTDFEPLWNIGLLASLAARGQLPDIHTDNLFSERSTEPERFDAKVLGRSMVSWGKYNLIKKARLLQRIGADFGLPRLWSPAAFWTLPRIERMLPRSEEKQADYLARYLVLCAASGAMERAWWGPLICRREGLIDDGETGYPALERITHYASVTGSLDRCRVRPAFHALRAFNARVPGSRYEGRLNETRDLEVHAFSTERQRFHVLWTTNGRAAALTDLYSSSDLQAAHCLSRDGRPCAVAPGLVGEAPLYLCWPGDRPVSLHAAADVLDNVAIDWHGAGGEYWLFRDDGWRGILKARNAAEARQLLDAIHPDRIGQPTGDATLRHARNAVWTIPDPRTRGAGLVVKQPVRMHLHKKWLDRRKPSKALRSWNGTSELLRRGIAAAAPVAYFEKVGDSSLTRNYYLCEHVPADFTARELMAAYAGGATRFKDIEANEAYRQLAAYLLTMHGRGIFFRDLSGGNILIRRGGEGSLAFTLIDTGRIRVYPRSLTLGRRLADLARICHKLHWAGRRQFMEHYLGALGGRFGMIHRLPFHLYDIKAGIKRSGIRKWLKRRLLGG